MLTSAVCVPERDRLRRRPYPRELSARHHDYDKRWRTQGYGGSLRQNQQPPAWRIAPTHHGVIRQRSFHRPRSPLRGLLHGWARGCHASAEFAVIYHRHQGDQWFVPGRVSYSIRSPILCSIRHQPVHPPDQPADLLPGVQGTGSRVQWLDIGPPRTETPPGIEPRFYRVLETQ